MQKKRFTSLQIFLSVIAVMFASAVFTAYATPPVSRYIPGETLDPTCAPGDAECSVIPVNIGDEVGSGNAYSVLYINDTGLLAEDNTNFLYDDFSATLYTDNATLANNLDITTTTSSTVGNITRDGQRILHFYSPGATAAASKNFFLGYQSGNYTLTGATGRNIGIGSNTLDSLTTGITNNALGFNAGTNITIGQSNNLFGGSAGQNLTTGTNNTAVGQAVLYGGGGIGTNTGSYNVAVGDIAMYQITDGLRNAGLGYAALENVTSGDDNAGLGYAAGNDVGTGSRGTYLGAWSDNDTAVADVSDVIAIGYGAIARADHQMVVGSDTSYVDDIYFGRGVKSATPNDVTINPTGGFGTDIAGADLFLAGGKGTGSAVGGDVIFTTADVGLTGTTLQSLTEKMRLTSGGRLGLGTTTPDSEFEISGETQNIELILSGYNGRKAVFSFLIPNGTEADPDPSAANDILAEFAGQGYGVTGFAPSTTAGIRVIAEETFDDSGYGSQLLFRTTPNNSTTLTSRMIIMADGNVGIGDTSPSALFTVGNGDLFQVNSSGAIAAATGVVSSGTITFSGLSTGVVINSGGTLSSSSQLAANRGGTAINTASSTGVPVIVSGTWSVPTTFVYDTSGNMLGIGDTTPDFKLDVETDAASSSAASFFNDGNNTNRAGILISAGVDDHTAVSTSTLIAFRDGDGTSVGSISFGSSATAYNTTSDVRLKDNIEDTDLSIDDLMNVQVRDFTWHADRDDKITHGFIAQELYDAYPSAVTLPAEENGYWMVDYSKLMPLAIKAIQDVNTKVIDLSDLSSGEEGTLGERLITWFADAANGIQNIFAKRVTVEELCFDDVCLTKQDVLELLNSADSNNDDGVDPEPNDGDEEVVPPSGDEEVVPPVDDESNTEEGSDSEVGNEGVGDEESAPADEGDTGGDTAGETGDSDANGEGETGGEAI